MFRNGDIKADQKAQYVKERGRPAKAKAKAGKVKLKKKVKKAA